MPKRTSNYATDDFVTPDDGDTPATKRSKTSDNSFTNARKAETGKQPVDTHMQKDENGDQYWELSSAGTRRVTVNEFKGNIMVNLREYYEAGGKKLPGKKGISLPIDQFVALVEALPQIESVLKKRGQTIPRPNYDGGPATEVDEDNPVRDENNEKEDAEPTSTKKNHEATSDEEE